MKRIISCLVLLSMLLAAVPQALAEEDSTGAELFAKGIGLIDESYDKSKVITRAEFAGILAELLRLNDSEADDKEWSESNLTDSGDSTVLINLSERSFSDVDVSHPYYSQITAVCQRGYMKGVSERLFAPEYNIVVADAVRVFINMLGYAEMAQLNSGIAGTIGLTDGISNASDRPATYGDIVKLIYNALDIKVLELKLDGSEARYDTSEESFMTAVLDMDKVKGVMTDNGKTSFTGASKLNKNQVRVGGIIAVVSDKTEYIRDFIGHTTELYYYTDGDEYEAVYAVIAKNDDSISFDIEDFESFENNTLTYYKGNRSVTKKLANPAYMIQNGRAKTVFDSSDFDFESGTVTLCAVDGSAYSVVIVECYEFAVVGSIDAGNELVYNAIKNPKEPDLNVIDLSEDGGYDEVTIKNAAGESISISDLAKNDVLNIKKTTDSIVIVVSKTKSEGFTVRSNDTDDDERRVISDGEKEYTVSKTYDGHSDKLSFGLGSTYAIYLNMFDRVVWAEKYSGGDNVGILTRVIYSEDDSEPFREMRLFSSGGKLERITVAEKIRFNDKNKKFSEIISDLEACCGQAIMYTLDENGIVTKVISPEAFGTFGDRGWYEIAPEPEGTYTYHANDNDLSQMMFYVKGTTTLFTAPTSAEDYEDEKAFSVNTYSFADGGRVKAVGYSTDKYDVIADVIVIKSDTTSAGAVSGLSDIFVIDKISQGLNDDDEVIEVMKGWLIDISAQNMSYTSISIAEDCVMVDKTGNALSTNPNVALTGPKKYSDLEPGDMIRFDTNTNKEVYKIRIAYDASTGSYFHTGAGGYGSDLPLYASGDEGSTSGSTWAGYAMTKSGTGIRVTRGVGTLPSNVNLSDASAVQSMLWAFKVNRPNAILVVEKGAGGKLEMRKGSIDDLMTYQDTGKNSTTDVVVMITEWSTATRGTVIYKSFTFGE